MWVFSLFFEYLKLQFLSDLIFFQGDWSVNAGNWNWISCGDPEEILKRRDDFCPVKHSKKLDPEGIYIRKYVKELRDFPIEYLFEVNFMIKSKPKIINVND